MRYTKHFLKKIEALLETVDFSIRYEKGNFNAGYCIVKDKRVAVINKFFDTEARINCLVEIVHAIEVDSSTLDEKDRKLYKLLLKQQQD